MFECSCDDGFYGLKMLKEDCHQRASPGAFLGRNGRKNAETGSHPCQNKLSPALDERVGLFALGHIGRRLRDQYDAVARPGASSLKKPGDRGRHDSIREELAKGVRRF
jgi:hypothetical protein